MKRTGTLSNKKFLKKIDFGNDLFNYFIFMQISNPNHVSKNKVGYKAVNNFRLKVHFLKLKFPFLILPGFFSKVKLIIQVLNQHNCLICFLLYFWNYYE